MLCTCIPYIYTTYEYYLTFMLIIRIVYTHTQVHYLKILYIYIVKNILHIINKIIIEVL